MDNKQNRQFYWEVKDFMAKKSNVDNKKPESLKESVKKILNEKNLYKTTNFIEETPLLNSVANHINKISHLERGYVTNDIRHARNNISNPFYLMEDEKSMAFMGAALKTAEQNKKNQEGQIASLTDLNTLSAEISAENEQLTPGVPLTREQRAKRDLEGTLKAQQQKAEEEEMEADRIARGLPDPRMTKDGREYSPQPDFVKPSQPTSPVSPQPTTATAGVDVEGPAVPTAEEERLAAAEAQKQKETTTSAAPVDPQQAEKDRFRQARIQAGQRRNTQRRQAAEQQLAALNTGDESRMSDSMRATRAANRVRLQQEIEGSKDISSDEISRRADSETKERFMTADEKTEREIRTKTGTAELLRKAGNEQAAKEVESKIAGLRGKLSTTPTTTATSVTTTQQSGTTPTPGTAPRPSGTTPAPGTALAAASMPNRGIGRTTTPAGTTPTPGTAPRPTGTTPGSSPTTNTSMSGSQVTSTARETLGLGSEPKPTQPTTPGVDAARETLGLGKPTTPQPQESEAKKKARDILLNK